MKNFIRIIFSLLVLAFALTGCATQKPETERIQYVFVKVPKELTTKVKAPRPPDINSYVTMTWDQKEDVLTKTIADQLQTIGTCNGRLEGVDTWSLEQDKIYKEKP